MSLAWWLNTAWMLKCLPECYAFRRATRRVEETQAGVWREIVRANADTEFGRRHHFARLRTPRDFQAEVPLSRYEGYAPAVERIGAGEGNVLTADAVELLEPTSGTTGGEKLIPYGRTLRRQFQRAVAAWIGDLFWQRPAVRRGRAYWSISPAFGPPRRSPAGIPIGFDEDAAYLGRLERFALNHLLVAPAALARIGDLATFRYASLFYLLGARNLSLVSIWNPTFLPALLAPLEEHAEQLCRDIRAGTPGHGMPPCTPDPRRAEEVAAILRGGGATGEKTRQLWPELALISCWTDAAAARCLPELTRLFPGVEIQSKGILATEGCVSFPLVDRPGAALALRSHFFEFDPVEKDGVPLLAHELEAGGRFRVILTTGGGLYRYQLRDEVEVVGFENKCPLLRFLGKADRTSDLVGEKLAEPFVRQLLDRLFHEWNLAPRFALLVPVEGEPSRYRLYVQLPDEESWPRRDFREALEAGLCANPHYAYAVGLGQLGPVEVVELDPAGEPGWRVYERVCVERGQTVGNVKPVSLDPWPHWRTRFDSRCARVCS